MKNMSYKKAILLFIICFTSIIVYAQKIDCEKNFPFYKSKPGEPIVRTQGLRIASENNLNTLSVQNEWFFSIVVGITSETADFYGGYDAVRNKVLEQFETINSAFNDPGVFNGKFNFSVESFYIFTDDVGVELYYTNPDYDYKVIIDGFPSSGGGWLGDYNTIYHSWPVNEWGGTFADYATDGLIHEFGHARGAIDLYALELPSENNPINGESYEIQFASIMKYPYGVTTWDEHSINLININTDVVMSNWDYMVQSFPPQIEFNTVDQNNNPLPGVLIRLYPVRWYSGRVETNSILETMTDNYGNALLIDNPFQISKTANDAWHIEYCNFLVEATYNNKSSYQWMPIFEVQNHYFSDPTTNYVISFTLPGEGQVITKIEIEDNYSKVTDVGSNGAVKIKSFPINSNGKAVAIPDKGDKINVAFSIPSAGQYKLRVWLRSGNATIPTSYFNPDYSYQFDISGIGIVNFSGVHSSVLGSFAAWGGSHWGFMEASVAFSSAGAKTLGIMAKYVWQAVDYLEIIGENGCLVCEGDITLSSQAEVDAFNCTEVTGNLTISGSDISNLDAFSSLTSIVGYLCICNNENLSSIHGLSSLKTIGMGYYAQSIGLSIVGNSLLGNIDGLVSLISIDGPLAISKNNNLSNLDGLSSLKTIGVGSWGEGLLISFNDILMNTDGLSSLTSIEGRLEVIKNNNLVTLDGLSSLTSIGDNVRITDNPSLSNCCGLFPLLDEGVVVTY